MYGYVHVHTIHTVAILHCRAYFLALHHNDVISAVKLAVCFANNYVHVVDCRLGNF